MVPEHSFAMAMNGGVVSSGDPQRILTVSAPRARCNRLELVSLKALPGPVERVGHGAARGAREVPVIKRRRPCAPTPERARLVCRAAAP